MIEEAAAASAAVKLWSVAIAALTISTMERCLSFSAGNNVGSIDDMNNGGGSKGRRCWSDCMLR